MHGKGGGFLPTFHIKARFGHPRQLILYHGGPAQVQKVSAGHGCSALVRVHSVDAPGRAPPCPPCPSRAPPPPRLPPVSSKLPKPFRQGFFFYV